MLLEVQRAMRASLLARDDRGISAHIVPVGLTPEARLAVYRNTFVAVLTNALRLAFPAVSRLVGAEFFEGAVRVFIEAHPPHNACLDDYGAEFPGFLVGFPPAALVAYLPDVARLEWAVNRALHAPDAGHLDLKRLAALEEADRAQVRFVPHPSVRLLHAQHPVDAIWHAVLERDDAALAAVDLAAGPVRLLIGRSLDGVAITRLGESAWRFALDLFAGEPLDAALVRLADGEASALLADHLAAGHFVDFRIHAPALRPLLGRVS